MQNLLWIVIQYAGASRGTLILRKEQSGEEWDKALSVSTDPHDHSPSEFSPNLSNHASIDSASDNLDAEITEASDIMSNNYEAPLMVGGELKSLVPLSMLNYVARTREMCVLNNLTSRDGMFSSDEYFRSVSPKAVLMFPIIHQVYLSSKKTKQNKTKQNKRKEQKL